MLNPAKTSWSRLGLAALAVLALTIGLSPAPAQAAGGNPAAVDDTPNEGPPARQMTPAEQADFLYNSGLRQRDKAWKLEKKLTEASDSKKAAKLEGKIEKAYEEATKNFIQAVQLNGEHYQAFSSLGYALRKRGLYADSLKAYNRAISLAPDYAEAIEYRGETYLALDRVDEAKEAYMALFSSDREKADQLMDAMKSWLEERKEEPGSLTPDVLAAFEEWVQQRDRVAQVVSPLTEQQARRW